MRDPYEVLQVQPAAELEVIRAAYRVLARKYHPDHGGDARRMIDLNDAWDVLGDPVRRAVYDSARAEAATLSPSNAAAAASAASAASSPSAGPTPSAGPARPTQSQSSAARGPDLANAGPPPGHPSGSVLEFGRYAGWSLGEIARYDVDYLEWLQRAPSGRGLRAEIDALVRQRRGAGPASTQGLPRR